MQIKVFKFGGGAVKDAEGVRQLSRVLARFSDVPLVVVISAIGKTTNLLEDIASGWKAVPGSTPDRVAADWAWQSISREWTANTREHLFWVLVETHDKVIRELMPNNPEHIMKTIQPLFEQLRTLLEQAPSGNDNKDYDRVVSYGELLSTTLIAKYLQLSGRQNRWLDAREVLVTDNTYREGKVDWKITVPLIKREVGDLMDTNTTNLIITQGFIGRSKEGVPITLGREGSDFTAAIFAYSLNAESVTIWKDVPGFYNADPKVFPHAIKLDTISYEEAIEMSYYGATIIHPKTIKPLQNKQIPLYVKSLFHPELQGSTIVKTGDIAQVPSYIFKKNQILISIYPKDFSFIAAGNLSAIFSILSNYNLKINMMQNTALSFSVCVDHVPEQVLPVLVSLKESYRVKYNTNVELATIRHYTEDILDRVAFNRVVLMEQRSRSTVQLVMK
ncbi:MAG: aspartate kinase [Bacteroidales bacterium]|nr:aspartate kinase [Bacteroidales bacterium]